MTNDEELWMSIEIDHTNPPLPVLEEGREQMYVTFQLRYANEPHPYFPWVHPNGYLTVDYPAGEYERARAALFAYTGGDHAFDYRRSSFEDSTHLYPAGEIARMVLP